MNQTLFQILALVLLLAVLAIQLRSLRVQNKTRSRLSQMETLYQQVEALFAIYATVQPRRPLPDMRIWAISPDFAKILLSELLRRPPAVIVDFGSGTSTLLAAYALERLNKEGAPRGHIYSFDHEARFLAKTRADLKAHGLEAHTTLIEAPTRAIECDGEHFEFYTVGKLADIDAVDLIIVDGPHGSRGILDRYPAVPLLYDKLQPGGVIIVDDAANFRESPDLMARWQKRYPQLIREDLPTEKGTVIFRKPR